MWKYMRITWKDEYDLGIESIDVQHRKLIDIINILEDAMRSGESGDEMSAATAKMRAYAEEHLAYEERLFERCGYTESDSHRAEHDVFRETIDEFQERTKGRDPIVAIEMLGYLEEWLMKHILVTDKKYVAAFTENGIK